MDKAKLLNAVNFLVKRAATKSLRQKLDDRGIGIEALKALMSQDFRGVWENSPLLRETANYERARREDNRRKLIEEFKYPKLHLDPKLVAAVQGAGPNGPMDPGMPNSQFGPMSPGKPSAPSNLLGLAGGGSGPAPVPLSQAIKGNLQDAFMSNSNEMPKFTSFVEYVMEKASEEAEEEEEEDEHEEGEIESPEHEAAESLPPEAMEQLVNYIQQMGPGIDDHGFHQEAESMGVDPHEAEEEVYRLLAALLGGQNDVIPGGLAAGMPTEQFPQEQIQKGTEVEMEHTGSPVMAQEIAKDHLAEGEDYYLPRLDELEENMEADVDAGKIDAVGEGTEKAKKNKETVEEDVKKVKKAAFKYGFFKKVADAGLKPSEVEQFLKQAGGRSLIGQGFAGAYDLAKTIGLLAFFIPTLGVPLLGAGGALGAYRLAREPDLDPEELRHIERIGLYERLSRQAQARARRHAVDEKEDEGESRPDDAHKKIMPMPTGGGIEI